MNNIISFTEFESHEIHDPRIDPHVYTYLVKANFSITKKIRIKKVSIEYEILEDSFLKQLEKDLSEINKVVTHYE